MRKFKHSSANWLGPKVARRNTGSHRTGLGRDQSGFIGTIILLIVLLVIAGMFVAFLPDLCKWIAGEWNLGKTHVYVPLFVSETGNAFMIPGEPISATGDREMMNVVEHTMGNLYEVFQYLAIIGLAVAFIMIGISFVLEQFRFIPEGTAYQTISESIFTIILIFAFPLIFNMIAMTLNGMNMGVITTSGNANINDMAGRIAFATGDPQIAGGAGGLLGIVLRLLFASLTMMAVFSAALVGVMRIILIGLMASIFPLMLVLRLIPFTKRVADIVTQTLFGLTFVSILSAAVFRFGYELLDPNVGVVNPMAWAVGMGIMSILAMLPTTLAPAVGRMMYRAGAMISGAVAGVVGGVTAAAGGTLGGGAIGAIGGAAHGTGLAGAGLRESVAARGGQALTGLMAGAQAGVGGLGMAALKKGHEAVDLKLTAPGGPYAKGVGDPQAVAQRMDDFFGKGGINEQSLAGIGALKYDGLMKSAKLLQKPDYLREHGIKSPEDTINSLTGSQLTKIMWAVQKGDGNLPTTRKEKDDYKHFDREWENTTGGNYDMIKKELLNSYYKVRNEAGDNTEKGLQAFIGLRKLADTELRYKLPEELIH